jgi:hypothetical protein
MPRNLNEIVRSWIWLQANIEYTLPLVVFFSLCSNRIAYNNPAEGMGGGWSQFSKRYIWACKSRFLLYDKVERKLRRTKHNNALLWCSECLQCVRYGTQSTHRVAMATYWRTFHHDGKISPAGEDGGCKPSSFHYIYHHEKSCGVCSSWEGKYTTGSSPSKFCHVQTRAHSHVF